MELGESVVLGGASYSYVVFCVQVLTFFFKSV